MNTKILAIIAIILIISSIAIPFISAKTIVWTEYSDSTSVEFTIIETQNHDDDNGSQDKPECPPNAIHPFNPIDEELEQSEQTYGDWNCINNRLQRQVTQNGLTEIEYGGICDIKLSASEKAKNPLAIIPLTLIILIILTLIAITALLLIRR